MRSLSAPPALLGLGFLEEQLSALNLGFLPRQGGQDSSWPHSCSREDVSVPGQELAWLSGKLKQHAPLSPLSLGGLGAAGGRASLRRAPASGTRREAGREVLGTSKPCGVKAGLARGPPLTRAGPSRSYPFVPLRKRRLPKGQRPRG